MHIPIFYLVGQSWWIGWYIIYCWSRISHVDLLLSQAGFAYFRKWDYIEVNWSVEEELDLSCFVSKLSANHIIVGYGPPTDQSQSDNFVRESRIEIQAVSSSEKYGDEYKQMDRYSDLLVTVSHASVKHTRF